MPLHDAPVFDLAAQVEGLAQTASYRTRTKLATTIFLTLEWDMGWHDCSVERHGTKCVDCASYSNLLALEQGQKRDWIWRLWFGRLDARHVILPEHY